MTKEERKAYKKEWYQQHKEQITAKKKAYYNENKENLLLLHNEYRKKHRKEANDFSKNYYQLNKENIKEKARLRRKTHKPFLKYCPIDYNHIQNYELALKDDFKGWHCHHKIGIKYTREEMIKMNLLYNRPAYELIFLPTTKKKSLETGIISHRALHNHYK